MVEHDKAIVMSATDQPDEEGASARAERHRLAERSHWKFEKIGGSIALFLTAVAAIGAIASAIAAFHAYDAANRAVDAATTANQINSRPYVKVVFHPETFRMHVPDPVSGDTPTVAFRLKNIGKLPGLVWVQSAVNWNGRGHSADDKGWPDIGIVARVFLFPDDDVPIFWSPAFSFTQGQLSDVATGDQYYVMIYALYGPSKDIRMTGPSREYETKVCTAFQMQRSADAITLGAGDPCPSQDSNYAR
jgi:hypothetical protein